METRFGTLLQAGDEGVQLLGGSVGAFQEGVPVEGVDNRFGHASGRPLPAHCTPLTQRLLLSPAGMEPMAHTWMIKKGFWDHY